MENMTLKNSMRPIGRMGTVAGIAVALVGTACGPKTDSVGMSQSSQVHAKALPATQPIVQSPDAGSALQDVSASTANASIGTPTNATAASDPAALLAADPVKFLQESVKRSRQFEGYKTTFIRQERLGLFKKLMPIENIAADYRAEPLSVRLTWTDPKSEYAQCVYIAGREDGKVLTLPRNGLLGGKPAVDKYPPEFGITFGKTRNLITDFGPRRMAERLLDRIEKAKPLGGMTHAYKGETTIGPNNEPCYWVEMRFPAKDAFPNKLLDLYICKMRLVPIATFMWLPGTPERSDKTLDASYIYAGIAPTAMADANFVIDAGGRTAEAQADESADAPNGKAVKASERSDG